jgi:hypothetical protein
MTDKKGNYFAGHFDGRGCTGEFSRAKAKKKILVPRRQHTQNKIIRAGRATSHSPPHINHRNHTRPLHPKSTPAILLSPHCWGKLAVLATQSQGDSTCACDCEARIVSLPLPAEKIISQTAQKHHHDGNSSAVISRSVPTRQVRFPLAQQEDARLSPKIPRHALYLQSCGRGS